jgi:trafficking protein particle complex subunit 4
MPLLQLFIINKNGGLMYNKSLSTAAPRQDINDLLRIASTFHSLIEISKQMSPLPGCTGIERLETDTFVLTSLQALTGVKIVITATADVQDVTQLARKVYEIYSDYVMKNPFYELDQPIHLSLFDTNLNGYLTRYYGSSNPMMAINNAKK